MSLVRMEVLESGVALITLDEPDRRNAITPSMAEKLSTLFDDLEGDQAVGAVIVTGAATAFSADRSKNVSTRWVKSDRVARARDAVGTKT